MRGQQLRTAIVEKEGPEGSSRKNFAKWTH
jgi:hypothetical protein